MSIAIIEVKTKKELKQFIDFPYTLYKNNKYWVPPLKIAVKEILEKKHPFYESSKMKLWLAIKKSQVVGRIAAISNETFNKFHGQNTGHFGFFESIEDYNVAKLLLSRAESYLKNLGHQEVSGPFNPSTNYECGLLIEGFDDPPQIMMTYNFEYYQKLLETHGYQKSKDLLAYQSETNPKFPPVMEKILERTKRNQNITFRSIDKKNWDEDIESMLEVYNDAWEKNWGFVPMSEAEFRHTANDLKLICDPNLIQFAFVKNNPVGFIVALLDYNQVFSKIKNGKLFPFGILKLLTGKRKINRARIITLGIKKEFQHMGLAPMLMRKCQQEIEKNKSLTELEQSWILEDNKAMNRPLELIGAKVYKKYRIFQKDII